MLDRKADGRKGLGGFAKFGGAEVGIRVCAELVEAAIRPLTLTSSNCLLALTTTLSHHQQAATMNFSQSRDDPHGVQRLLDILRRQQDASSTSPSSAPSTSTTTAPSTSAVPSTSTQPYPPNPFSPSYSTAGAVDHTSSTVDPQAEAAQRRRTYNTSSSKYGIPTPADEPFDPYYSFNPFSASNPVLSHPAPAASPPKPSPAPTSKPKPRDLASLSFAEALPILSTLSTDEALLRRLRTLRTQQHDLEKRLVKEYRQFAATADKQYPNVKARKEQDEKRRTAMLKQWDECVAQQQEELNRAGVPGVKVTRDRRETEKQRKVLNVLVEMMDDEGEVKSMGSHV